MSRMFFIICSVLFVFLLQFSFAQTQNQQLTGQRFSGEIIVQASPAKVWELLTDAPQFTEIMGYEYLGGAKKFTQVGSDARVKVWGDPSRFMLVRATPQKELRFNLDPANGSYICNCRWKLSKTANGTRVWFEERYTESSPQSKEDLTAQVKDANEMLGRLKHKVETE